MELHEKSEHAMKAENIKQFVSYMKNHTSNPLATTNDILKVMDLIWTEVSNY